MEYVAEIELLMVQVVVEGDIKYRLTWRREQELREKRRWCYIEYTGSFVTKPGGLCHDDVLLLSRSGWMELMERLE